MAADVFPILLRPPTWMADAMERAAAEAGCSRNEWMVCALQNALGDLGHHPPRENVADQPLPIEVG